MAIGTQYIQETINEYEMAIFDENEEEDLALLTQVCLSLEQTIPPIREHFKHYLSELHRPIRK